MSNETIDTELETLPSEPQEPVQEEAPIEPIIFNVDPALLIGEFLKDKEVSDDDSLNLELFLKGDSSGWRFKNISAPSLEELKALEPQVSSAQSQQVINEEAQKFLDSTDWLIIREIDAGIFCPLEIKQKRQEAREKIVK